MIKKKNPQQTRRELPYSEGIYKIPTANILLNSEILNAFPLRLGTRQEGAWVKLKIVLVIALRQEEEKQSSEKEEVKLSVLAKDFLIIKQLLEPIINLARLWDNKFFNIFTANNQKINPIQNSMQKIEQE